MSPLSYGSISIVAFLFCKLTRKINLREKKTTLRGGSKKGGYLVKRFLCCLSACLGKDVGFFAGALRALGCSKRYRNGNDVLNGIDLTFMDFKMETVSSGQKVKEFHHFFDRTLLTCNKNAM